MVVSLWIWCTIHLGRFYRHHKKRSRPSTKSVNPDDRIPQLTNDPQEELKEQYGIDFNNLFTLANMPIKRFADFLYRRSELSDYMDVLVKSYNPETVAGLMCTNHVSVGW